MGRQFTKHINQDFFKIWTSKMSYVLGYIVADGCIAVSRNRKKNPYTLNITSVDKEHLQRFRKALGSSHKISKKSSGNPDFPAYQLQVRNPIMTKDLIDLGILPRKTYHLNPIRVPERYFSDFVRGFFDGDGSVYIYEVNRSPQIKASFVSTSSSFITELNKRLCTSLDIPLKAIHREVPERGERKLTQYAICFYVDDCERLAKFMYKGNPSLYLPRKCQIFEKWKLIKRRHYVKHDYPSKVGWQLNQKVFV